MAEMLSILAIAVAEKAVWRISAIGRSTCRMRSIGSADSRRLFLTKKSLAKSHEA